MKTNRRFVPVVLAVWIALIFAPGIVRAQSSSSSSLPLTASLREQIFTLVWTRVRDRHYDPALGGLNWNVVRKKYRPLALSAKGDDAFYGVLNAMLGELKQSHLGVLPPDRADLSSIVAPNGGQPGTIGDTGIGALLLGDQMVVTSVAADSAAAKAGVRPGDAITAVDGKPFAATLEKIHARVKRPGEERVFAWGLLRSLLSGPIGSSVKVTTLAGENDAAREITLTRERTPGERVTFGALPTEMTQFETRTLAGGIGYVRFNIWLMPLMEPIRKAMKQFAAENAPGIIIDLRGNIGGLGAMAPAVAGMLATTPSSLGAMKMREATLRFPVTPQAPKYAGPVVILTDEGSLSTSEIFAGALQESGRATVIGRLTGGMVLPSQIEALPGGARLQYVTADYRTPKGVLLEGKGVAPAIPVSLTRATLRESPDPTLDAAIAFLQNRSAVKKEK